MATVNALYEKYLPLFRELSKMSKTINANDMGLFRQRKLEIAQRIEALEERIKDAKKKAKTEGKGLKVMTLAQMLRRLPIAMAQVKAGNNSQALKNKIRQMLYSLYQGKQLTKKIYQDLMSKV